MEAYRGLKIFQWDLKRLLLVLEFPSLWTKYNKIPEIGNLWKDFGRERLNMNHNETTFNKTRKKSIQ